MKGSHSCTNYLPKSLKIRWYFWNYLQYRWFEIIYRTCCFYLTAYISLCHFLEMELFSLSVCSGALQKLWWQVSKEELGCCPGKVGTRRWGWQESQPHSGSRCLWNLVSCLAPICYIMYRCWFVTAIMVQPFITLTLFPKYSKRQIF